MELCGKRFCHAPSKFYHPFVDKVNQIERVGASGRTLNKIMWLFPYEVVNVGGQPGTGGNETLLPQTRPNGSLRGIIVNNGQEMYRLHGLQELRM